MDVLEIVKAKVSADKLPSDQLLEMHVAEVRQAILTFCNRTDIPQELVFVHANMVVDLISVDTQQVTAIKEGDVQVSFGGTSASQTATQQILYNYKTQLKCYRKLRW